MTRMVNIARLQVLTWFSAIAMPWLVLALSMAINLTVFALAHDGGTETGGSGGMLALYIFVFVAATMTVREYFPFALGLSATRHAFFTATTGLAVAQAVVYGTVLLVLSSIERATSGWGVGMNFFHLPFFNELGPALLLFSYVVPMLLMWASGMFIGTLTKRWGATGLITAAAVSVIVFGGGSVLMTLQQWWLPLGSWLAAQPIASLTIGWPLLLIAILGGGSFLILRRTTP